MAWPVFGSSGAAFTSFSRARGKGAGGTKYPGRDDDFVEARTTQRDGRDAIGRSEIRVVKRLAGGGAMTSSTRKRFCQYFRLFQGERFPPPR